MNSMLRALEVTGTVDEQQMLHLDAPLPITGPARARVIILLPEETDLDEREWLRSAAANPAFADLHEPDQDIYSQADGKPFHDEIADSA